MLNSKKQYLFHSFRSSIFDSLYLSLGRISRVFLMSMLCLGSIFSQSADNRDLTKEEVGLQTRFIDAKKLAFLGKYEQAIEEFKSILDENLKTPAVYYELSKIYNEEDQSELAYKNIKKAILYDKSNVWYYIFLAQLQESDKDLKGVQETYFELNRIKPNDPELMTKLGDVSTQLADYDNALKIFSQYEKSFGISEHISESKFEIYKLQNDQKSAMEVLTSLAAAFPDNQRYQDNLRLYQQSIGVNKNKETHAKGGIVEKYLPLVQDANVDVDTKIAQLVVLIDPERQHSNEDIEQINEVLDAFIELNGGEAKVLALAGDFYFNQGDYSKAANFYDQTLALDKSKYSVWAAYCDALALQSDYEKLADVSDNALDFFPNQALLYYYNGVAIAELSNAAADKKGLNKANETLALASTMAKRKPSLLYNILLAQAQNQIWLGDKKRASSILDQAEELQVGNNKNMEYIRNQL